MMMNEDSIEDTGIRRGKTGVDVLNERAAGDGRRGCLAELCVTPGIGVVQRLLEEDEVEGRGKVPAGCDSVAGDGIDDVEERPAGDEAHGVLAQEGIEGREERIIDARHVGS